MISKPISMAVILTVNGHGSDVTEKLRLQTNLQFETRLLIAQREALGALR